MSRIDTLYDIVSDLKEKMNKDSYKLNTNFNGIVDKLETIFNEINTIKNGLDGCDEIHLTQDYKIRNIQKKLTEIDDKLNNILVKLDKFCEEYKQDKLDKEKLNNTEETDSIKKK